MAKTKIGNTGDNLSAVVLLATVGLGAWIVSKIFPSGTPAPPIEPGWTPPVGAHITVAQAGVMASNIKDAIGYTSIDWDAIATEFEKCWNRYDVEVLYKAFGTWDGPYTWNGDLFNVLAKCYDPAMMVRNRADLQSIKAHCYEYSNNIKW